MTVVSQGPPLLISDTVAVGGDFRGSDVCDAPAVSVLVGIPACIFKVGDLFA